MKFNRNGFLGILIFISSLILIGCGKGNKTPSAANNVQLLPYQFVMDDLGRQRSVRLYLPTDYATSDKNYPVIYMHDGQDLFDNATAERIEWQVDESLNKLASNGGLEFIIVGIDGGGDKRKNELSPWENRRFGLPEGKQYMNFLIEVVKPYIDTNYRTKSDPLHTAIMGAGMGGLISHYALHMYPEVFSKAAIFSPAYWYSEDVFAFTRFKKAKLDTRLYVMYGSKEGDGMIADTYRMQRQLKEQGYPRNNMQFKRVENDEHNEILWRNQFSEAVTWLFQQQPTF